MKTKDENHALEQAKCQLASIREMVAALTCDYYRLEALREERDDYDVDDADDRAIQTGEKNLEEIWASDNPDDSQELARLEIDAGDCESEEAARQAITEDPLSVQVRSDWHDVDRPGEASEFCILLCTGGPACRIVGELENDEPFSARIEYQDWGTPWTDYQLSSEEMEDVLTYCRCFYFGS